MKGILRMSSPTKLLTVSTVLKSFKKHVVLILASTLFISGVAYVYANYLATPKFRAQTQLISKASSENGDISVGQVQVSTQMSTTLSQVLVSPIILNEVIDTLSLGISADELKNELVVASSAASQVLTLTVTDTSAARAADIANTMADVFTKRVPKLTNVSTVSVLAEAMPNQKPTSPNKTLIMSAGVIIGMAMGMLLSLTLTLFSTKIQSQSDLDALELTTLGQISVF